MAKTGAFLEDHAFLIDGLLALHISASQKEAIARAIEGRDGGSRRLLAQSPLSYACELTDLARALFGAPSGGFFDTRADQSDVFMRARSTHDGAIPSGASVMLASLVELHSLVGNGGYLDAAKGTLASLSAAIAESPVGAANAVRSLLRLVQSGAVADGGETAEPAKSRFTPVEIFATEERITVGKDRPAKLRLVMKIAEGYHINAAEPGDEKLVGLRVWVVNGGGIAAYADYPKGEPYGPDGKTRVHRGSIEFDVAVEKSGEITGRPLLAVTFQACTDRECLAPMTAELAVAIDPE